MFTDYSVLVTVFILHFHALPRVMFSNNSMRKVLFLLGQRITLAKKRLKAAEMAQKLIRVHTTLAEDPGSVPSTDVGQLTNTYNYTCTGPRSFFLFFQTSKSMCTYINKDRTRAWVNVYSIPEPLSFFFWWELGVCVCVTNQSQSVLISLFL